ncbi:MAG TPA: acyl-CoA dehydrogenase family protein [Verrucomicrobiae bacterium]|jgi:alkylation response protein AidB-like acyl-CoA dehydrogenase|nr:acyl-CoA dehydrogenase family protein [Verrucomicrobiae bacterium]
MTTLTEIPGKTRGSAFLFEDALPTQVFTPEDLTEEHLAIGRMIDEFWASEVEPNLPAIREKKPGAALAVLRKSADLGLTGMTIPEEFGGMEMDLPSLMVAAEHMGRDASYAGWHSAHTGIGTLPLVYFGTSEQKKKYLPRLARMELLAAYALTEPLAGSDALAARTRADLAPDGKHFILNGQKMWITNGGAADLFTIFAKVGGEKFTAFLVERAFPGVSSGAEEHKMGIRGTSTTAVYLDNVAVPVENLLGEIGRGHVIAFNVLNIGRLKLGPASVGAAKNVLAICIKYAKQRKAFGSAIADFGAIQHKLAEMAIRVFVAECMTWRVAGLIETQMQASAAERRQSSITEMHAVEEYAAECSMVKVFASEMLDYVVDEGVQIHGGYGFHQDYAVERAYRDSRINRLFEGTNEINRLVIMGMPLKRAARGQLPLLEAARSVLNQSENPGLSNEKQAATKTEEDCIVRNAKKIFLLTLAVAHDRSGAQLEKQQEVIMNLSDIAMEVFAMESGLLRRKKLTSSGKSENALDICAVYLRDAIARIEGFSRTVLSACCEREVLRKHLATVRGYADHMPVNSIALRRQIAARLLSSERYTV